jgi:hypothetical protein
MFMSTGIESWTPVKEVAALSPFSGGEVLLTIIAVVIDHHCGGSLDWLADLAD